MTRQLRTIATLALLAAGYVTPAHGQPMLSYYGIEIDERFTLIHSARDAFQVIDGNDEVLMIDPVWDNMQLDAYSKLAGALLVRAHATGEAGRAPDAVRMYFIIEPPDTESTAICTGPLSEAEFQKEAASLPTVGGNIKWVEPSDPNPSMKRGMLALLVTMSLTVIAGYVLPVPFVLILAHYIVLRRRLKRLTAI